MSKQHSLTQQVFSPRMYNYIVHACRLQLYRIGIFLIINLSACNVFRSCDVAILAVKMLEFLYALLIYDAFAY